jgi:NAD-dependent DNA ligase
MQVNGGGDEICLTGFTTQEKMKLGEILAKKGCRFISSVTSGLRFLVTPAGTYKGSRSKEIEAKNVGSKIVDLNTLLNSDV